MKYFNWLFTVFAMVACQTATSQDTIVVQTFTFADPSPEGWNASYRGTFEFPSMENSWERILMVRTLRCDSATKGDQYPCGEWDYLTHTLVHIPAGDTTEVFQLGSFVTPYGKRLEMGGEKGWTWVYDVTDYAPLLTGTVDLESGNNQELLDMKFLFIPGVPTRKVISVENLYPFGTYKYGPLADDSVLQAKKIRLNTGGSGFMLRARISGHGHEGPNNCCEWDRKAHKYFINGWLEHSWTVWKDCGFNPIYPQGGTWPFDRAGWCPGTKVDEYDYELTGKYFPGDTVTIDYGIEMYRNNGERNGEFRMSHQLFTYGPPIHELDARMDDIIAPSGADSHSRVNPICSSPVIVIRNTGSRTLHSALITYGYAGEEILDYNWYGRLEFLEQEEVVLPAVGLPENDEKPVFMVTITQPNGEEDEYPANNSLSTGVKLPEALPGEFILHILSNDKGRAKENSWTITDEMGGWMYGNECLSDSTVYNERITLQAGCYEFRLRDSMEDGMNRHWWYRNSNPELVGINGRIEIHSTGGEVLRTFQYDFGQEILFRFRVID